MQKERHLKKIMYVYLQSLGGHHRQIQEPFTALKLSRPGNGDTGEHAAVV